MQKMYAKQYALSREYPYATIRRLCREGILPSETIGRAYQIYVEEADAVMDKRKYAPKAPAEREDKPFKETKPAIRAAGKNFDFLAELEKAARL